MIGKSRTIGFLLAIAFWWACGPPVVHAVDPAIEDYTAYPMFVIQAVKPNILIVLDNSGSMNRMAYGLHEDGAYHPDNFGCIVDGIAEGGGATTLVDNQATFTGKVAVGDILHNIDDGSTGTIMGVTDTTLTINGQMSNGHTNDNDEHYWVEHQALKDPNKVEEGYYGYFVPTAHYTFASNVFVRDDTSGQWSGTFLNWLTMRRVDLARKVLMGGLATSRTGIGNQHLIGESPALIDYKFLKIVANPSGHSPYDNRHFYRIADGYIEVYRLDDGEPDLDYTKDFTVEDIVNAGDDHILADYEFDAVGGAYEIHWRYPVIGGEADSLIDNPIDANSCYRHYLFDPSQDFRGVVSPGDRYVNDSEGSIGYVSAVPESVAELLAALPSSVLYDMFHNEGDGLDGYVRCQYYCEPDVDYLPCQDDANWAQCMADGDLDVALAPLIGHIVVFSTPLNPFGPNAGEKYHFEPTATATRIARLKIEVDRNMTAPDEARDFVDGNLAGVLDRLWDKARFGLEFFNKDNEGGNVASAVGDPNTDLITNIQNEACDTYTPLAESLYEGIRYFRQESPFYHNGDYTINNTWDPYYFNDLARFVECSGSFILQITDGESTEDLNIPAELRDYDTDGSDPGTYESNGSDYLDDVALWGHTEDHRADLAGTQNITYYTVFAFGKGSALLQDAARNGGFIDVNGDNRPEPSGGDAETIRQEWDRNGDGVPDTYFEAQRGFELESKVYQAITEILKRAASGTAVSVLSTSERGEGTVYQAFFKPKVTQGYEDIKWLGYLQSLWVDANGNLREETAGDRALVLTEDKIIRYRFDPGVQQTYVDRFSDSNGNSVIDALEDLDGDGDPDAVDAQGNPIPDDSIPLENLSAIWEAGRLLALRDPAGRRIITFADSNWDGVVDTTEVVNFSTGDLARFEALLEVNGDDPSSYSYLGAADQRASNLVQFIRGTQVSGLRDRRVTVDGALEVWKLGDIVFSTPTVALQPLDAFDKLYGDYTYAQFARHWKDRKGMVYIGANDGMLHAFRAGRFIADDNPTTAGKVEAGYFEETDLGTEAWAYIPFNLLSHLKWLADPDYTHVFYVDLKAKVADVRIFSEDMDHPNGWGTLLVGGMRLGGGPYPHDLNGDGDVTDVGEGTFRSAYFLIDVTDPEDPEVLAEFTHPQLGFSTSYPAITRVEAGGVAKWFMIVGSGPTPGSTPPYRYDGTSEQVGKIFVLNLTDLMSTRQIREGNELTIIDGLENEAFMADAISVDMLLDYSVDVIYIGESYWESNRWKGRMYRLLTNGSTNPATWTLGTLYQTAVDQPITAAPSASVGFNNDLWVYFGTGRFYNYLDEADTNTQSFYGIHDPCLEGGSCGEVPSDDVLDVTNEQVFTDQTVSGLTGVGDFAELEGTFSGPSLSKYGWKMDFLTPGERSLSKPSVLGGAVLFTTYIPDADICSMGGDGKLYALYFLTGTAHYKAMLGVVSETTESKKSAGLGQGMPASLGVHVGTSEGATGFVQTSTGNIMQLEVVPALQFKSGTRSWRQS